MRARRDVEGSPMRPIENHWQLVLGASQGKPQAVFAALNWLTRQFMQDGDDVLVVQPLNDIAEDRHW